MLNYGHDLQIDLIYTFLFVFWVLNSSYKWVIPPKKREKRLIESKLPCKVEVKSLNYMKSTFMFTVAMMFSTSSLSILLISLFVSFFSFFFK